MFEGIDDWNDAIVGAGELIARLQAIQNEDHRIAGKLRSQAPSFHELGHEEMPAAMVIEARRDPVRAKPIGIRLDDCCGPRRRNFRHKPVVIANERRKIDREVA